MTLIVLSKPVLPVIPTTILLAGLQLIVTGIFVGVDTFELRYTEMDCELEQEVWLRLLLDSKFLICIMAIFCVLI